MDPTHTTAPESRERRRLTTVAIVHVHLASPYPLIPIFQLAVDDWMRNIPATPVVVQFSVRCCDVDIGENTNQNFIVMPIDPSQGTDDVRVIAIYIFFSFPRDLLQEFLGGIY
jgi:hypothetical protein